MRKPTQTLGKCLGYSETWDIGNISVLTPAPILLGEAKDILEVVHSGAKCTWSLAKQRKAWSSGHVEPMHEMCMLQTGADPAQALTAGRKHSCKGTYK